MSWISDVQYFSGFDYKMWRVFRQVCVGYSDKYVAVITDRRRPILLILLLAAIFDYFWAKIPNSEPNVLSLLFSHESLEKKLYFTFDPFNFSNKTTFFVFKIAVPSEQIMQFDVL